MWPQLSGGVGARQDSRLRTAFLVAVGGAALCVVGVVMPWIEGTNSQTGLSETLKGTDKLGVGWWPVVFAALAVAALVVVRRRSDLSATALAGVAAGFGALDLLYVLYRGGDAKDQVKKISFGTVSVDNKAGYYVLLLGTIGVLAGAVWFLLISRGANRARSVAAPPGQPLGYPAGSYVAPPFAAPPPPPPQPPVAAFPPPVPAPPGRPQPPRAVYPGQAPPPVGAGR